MLEELKREVMEANKDIERFALAGLTWGNVSGIDRARGLIVIKPSGVSYSKLTPDDMVVVDLDNKKVEGALRPSVDTVTHIMLYRAFPAAGGIVHTHSTCAVAFAQALREIPCFGTTHADHFLGTIPLTRNLTPAEIAEDYEGNTGKVIIERFTDLNPADMPAVLVAHHAPFVWGKSAADALKNAVALEHVADMAQRTLALNPSLGPIPAHILDEHYNRKHGPDARYGQGKANKN
jgi:L-ribulose-5-phosphate 4-epimerase